MAAVWTGVGLVVDSAFEGGNFWDNLGDKFEISNNEFWKMEALQVFGLTILTGGPTNGYGFTAFGLDRGTNYFLDREERGKVSTLDLGFTEVKVSSVFQLASLSVSSYNYFGVPESNGLTPYQNFASDTWYFGLWGTGVGQYRMLPFAF